MDERRRYFRIEDTIGIRYERLTQKQAQERQQALSLGEYAANNDLQDTERQLQLIIDKLRVQNPEISEAIDLLNRKFNLLKNDTLATEETSKAVRASISACGVNFDIEEEFAPQEEVFVDITLLPTDLHIQTIAQVVACSRIEESASEDRGVWSIALDFVGLRPEMEELLVQHLVKRQGRLIAQERQKQV